MASPPRASIGSPPSGALGRLSLDSNRGAVPNGVNGHGHDSNHVHDIITNGSVEPTEEGTVESLQLELERTRAEKDVLADQYRSLLGKLTTMRTTLGNKLKEDAVGTLRWVFDT